jgi:hypothetical protein
MGLKQVAEIEAEMLKLARQQGYNDLPSFNEHIRKDPHLYATSGEQLLGLYKHYTDQMYAKLPQLVRPLAQDETGSETHGGVPRGELRSPRIIRSARVTAHAPAASTSMNTTPRIDCCSTWKPSPTMRASPATICNFPSPRKQTDLPTSAGLLTTTPTRRVGRSTQSGWAGKWASTRTPIANTAGWKMKCGAPSAWWWIPAFTSKHWSRQQMVDYFRQHTAMDEPMIENEVDRYIAWPGQALAYKLGQMKIIELRERARQQLGERFDLRAFHDALLAMGPCPSMCWRRT